MIAEFYIVPESFENNQNLSKTDIEGRIKSLSQDFIRIKQHKDSNKIYVNPQIYTVIFVGNATISDLLFNPEVKKKYIDRDVELAIKKIVIESAETEFALDEIIEVLLPNHNEEICYGLIAFNEIENIENKYQIVYSINDWYAFRRHFLGAYPHPHDGEYFIEECRKYFPDLFFHERNKKTVLDILGVCAQRIVFHLAALNDQFRASCRSDLNRSQILKHFSHAAELDEEATLEGTASRKKDFTFDFINDQGVSENVCCEPHLKLCYNDKYPGDTSYSNNRRIYFHEGKTNIQQGKILIGHIGSHL